VIRRVDRSDRAFVEVAGPDAHSYLQSIVSQDLDAMADGDAVPSLLLHPQGKLDHIVRILRLDGEHYLLEADPGRNEALVASLARFKIRVRCDIADRTGEWGLVTFVGGDAPPTPAGVSRVPTRWGDEPGVDVLGPRAALETWHAALGPDAGELLDAGAFEALRIAAGVPVVGVDVDDGTIPQEAFLDADAISFTKGCFIGQELVTRIDTRGHVNRYLRVLDVPGAVTPPPGASVHAGESAGAKEVGTVTSAAPVPGEDRSVALALVRRELEPPAAVMISVGDSELAATLVGW
jgi:folate-binding protein YgfZ